MHRHWKRALGKVAELYRARARRRTVVTAEAVLEAARAVTRRKTYCVLATRSSNGVHARVVQPWRPTDHFTVWMGTSPASRKVAELTACPRATLVYEDDRASACVVLEGRVELVSDPTILGHRFMPFWRAFFPAGPEEDFVALRFETSRIEVIDFSRHVTPEPFGLQAAALVRGEGEAWALEPMPT